MVKLLQTSKDLHPLCLQQGGRKVLHLYGYTNQQIDGLSFPDEVSDPDGEKVSAVTLEVMTLRTEVDMLVKVGVCAQRVAWLLVCEGFT